MDADGEGLGVLIRWMDRLDAGLAPVIFGNGRQAMDVVHVEDVARAIVLASISPASGLALDVAGGEKASLLDLARLLARVMGRGSVQPEFRPQRGLASVPRRPADTRPARETIGFEAGTPLAAGIEELATWWCAERDRAAPVEAAV